MAREVEREQPAERLADHGDPAAPHAQRIGGALDGLGPVLPAGPIEVLERRAVARESRRPDGEACPGERFAEVTDLVRRPGEPVNEHHADLVIADEVERLSQRRAVPHSHGSRLNTPPHTLTGTGPYGQIDRAA